MPAPENVWPRLRPISVRTVEQRGMPAFLLRDPLRLTDSYVIVPKALGPALVLCDGTRNGQTICEELADSYQLPLDHATFDQLIEALDDALLLDNDHFAQAYERARAEYRNAPFRPMALAGQAYPADANELRASFRGYLAEVELHTAPLSSGKGIFSPHIDYTRGGSVYAAVWQHAAALARDAELVVLLATDHAAGESAITLTRQHYATPFGVLPTAVDVVDALAETLGEQAAFADELHHCHEHSIELVATWLHFMRDERPCALVPILCGSFGSFIQENDDPAHDRTLTAVLDTLRAATAGRRTLVVASGDMSHVGPAFGGSPLYRPGWEATRRSDDVLIEQLVAGDTAGFFGAIQRIGDRTNVCGVAPFWLALQLMVEPRGELVAYDQCPADDQRTSLVSVCGIAYP